MKIFTQEIEELFNKLSSSKNGLNDKEVSEKRKIFGYNRLNEEKKESILFVFLNQFKDTLIIILIIAAIISFISGSKGGSVVILVVLIINSLLGTIQHIKAQKSMESLKKLSSPKTKVLRNGIKIDLNSDELVPGDIIFLEAGDVVPADGRIISSFSLMVSETSLTGESEAVEKNNNVLKYEDLSIGDIKNMVFSSSLVTYGRAEVLVTSIGMNTEIGKIAKLLESTEAKKTPLQVSMDDFGKKLSFAIIILCICIFALYVSHGNPYIDSLLVSVALAVAAIPEALSPIITIVLSFESKNLSKENAIIKDLKSVEALGSVSVICSDKTGTLTQNKMTVKNFYINNKIYKENELNLNNSNEEILLDAMILVSDATDIVGDPTEIALIQNAKNYNINFNDIRSRFKRLDELPFDSDRKLMSTLINYKGKSTLFTKGATDNLLNKLTFIMQADGNIKNISNEEKEEIVSANHYFAKNGLRVLCLAMKLEKIEKLSYTDEDNYIFLGLVAMIDPPREESKKAVEDATRAGIKTVMITGDHKITATAIAKEIGIFKDGDMVLEGIELEKMTDEDLEKVVKNVTVYARVSPEHKIRIVNAWQKLDYIVSMTGDGVNDAPALKQANIGIAMGITGTEVSKNAASMILADDNFATIIKTVISGRNIFKNIKNSIGYLLSGNLSAIIAVIYTTVLNLPIIFSPVQLLFINLLTDSLPAIAIGLEPKNNEVLDEKPRDQKDSILNKYFIFSMAIKGLLISIFVLIAFYIGLKKGGAVKASTMAFATLSLARLFHLVNYRNNKNIFTVGLFSNKMAIYAFLIGFILLFAVLFTPILFSLFVTTAITLNDFLQIILLAILPTIIIQISKAIKYKK